MKEEPLLKLINLSEEAVQSAISDYTSYMVTSAIVWIVVAIIVIVGVFIVWKFREKVEDEDDPKKLILFLALLIAFIISAVSIPVNIVQLSNPRAIAIHQLLGDATGSDW